MSNHIPFFFMSSLDITRSSGLFPQSNLKLSIVLIPSSVLFCYVPSEVVLRNLIIYFFVLDSDILKFLRHTLLKHPKKKIAFRNIREVMRKSVYQGIRESKKVDKLEAVEEQ